MLLSPGASPLVSGPAPLVARGRTGETRSALTESIIGNLSDTLQRFLFEHAPIRGEIVQLDATWRALLERHDYPPPLRALLGELMAAAALLAATLKFSGSPVLQVHGSGPVSLIVVAIDGASVAAMLEHYMRNSEQLDTILKLAATEARAAGLLLRKLPQGAEQDADDWRRAAMLTATLSDAELLALAPQNILHRLYNEDDLRLFDQETMTYDPSPPWRRNALAPGLLITNHQSRLSAAQHPPRHSNGGGVN